MKDAIYKVLWVDDQPELVQGYQWWAGLRNIQLIHRESWKDAVPILKKDFNELTAIILDANCKWSTSDKDLSENFLTDVLSELQSFCGETRREIPWYILSAATMSNFNWITSHLIDRKRLERVSEWGETVYYKSDLEKLGEDCPLFENIRKVGDTQSNNVVLYRHRDAFSYLGEDSLIRGEARKIMLKALAAAYYPDENLNYEFAGNPLRKVLEYLYKSANLHGLLPDEFFKDGKPVLWDSMQYMCGIEPSNIKIRFGRGNDTIFPKRESFLLLNILNFVNEDSHTGKDEDAPYVINKDSKDLFFGFIFQLLHIISFYGQFVDAHPDIEANKAMKQKIQAAADLVIGKEGYVLAGSKFNYMGNTVIANKLGCRPGQKIRIDEAVLNTGADKDKYPTYATKITILQ